MAIGRVNVANVDVKNLSIFEIDSSIDTTYERSFNVFSQVGTNSTRHQIYSGDGKAYYPFMSYGRKGNILILTPIKEGENLWIVEYDFDKGEFRKQQEVELGPSNSRLVVTVLDDFNNVKLKQGGKEKIVTLGAVKTSYPGYGAWVSNNMSVSIEEEDAYSVNITYYKNGNEKMFNIRKDYYFFSGFMFVSDKIAVVATQEGELQAVKIHDVNNFTEQVKKDSTTIVGWFGGSGYQFIYDAANDTFLDINIKTGHAVERRFVYKSVDW